MSFRAKCTLTAGSCEVILKAHVRSIGGGEYLNEDMEVIISSYLPFLTACACLTTRLSSSVVAQAAVQVLGVSTAVGLKFGQSMSGALSYCYLKGQKATTGKRLSDGVRAICLSFSGDQFGTLKSPNEKHAHIGDRQSNSTSSSSSSSFLAIADSPPGASAAAAAAAAAAGATPPQASAAAADTIAAIHELYGLAHPPAKKQRAVDLHGIAEVVSSQEVLPSQDALQQPMVREIAVDFDVGGHMYEQL